MLALLCSLLLPLRPIAAGLACLFALELGGAARGERPNIVVIYTDDQGTLDAACYGAADLVTPTFDKLAAAGVRFTQMYAPSAICSASRAGLLTGRFPPRAGTPGNVSSQQGVAGMPAAETTIAEMLRAAGYRTGHVGKWHLGYTTETMPNGQGFEESVGHMGGCIDNYSHFFYWNGPNRHDLWRNGREIWLSGRNFGDVMVDECCALITRWKDEPFFLYWAINWPHYPLQADDHWREAYAHLPHPRDKYAAFVSALDARIGQVIDHLETLGLRDNTLIVLQSDHGHSVEERAFGGGGYAGPYRGAKGSLFEGGIRVPAIVSWPARFPQGAVREQLATGCDWAPTLAEVAGAAPQAAWDGRSLVEVIENETAPSPHRTWYWRMGEGPQAQWAVRQGPWKLLGHARDPQKGRPVVEEGGLFLANLELDPTEQTNYAEQHPAELAELLAAQQQYEASISGEP